jgi:hypothetical protein
MEVLRVPREVARFLADIGAPYVVPAHLAPSCAPAAVIAENRFTGELKRWTSVHELVIRTADGGMWRAFYEQGLTEMQCDEPFGWGGDVVEFTAVRPAPSRCVEYVPCD